MSQPSRHFAAFLCTALVLGVGCDKPSNSTPNETGQIHSSLVVEVPPGMCPGRLDSNSTFPGPGDWYDYYISDDVVSSVPSAQYMCKSWLARKEAYLCSAYFWFNLATRFDNLGGDFVQRQQYFRNTIESLSDVFFDLADYEGGDPSLWDPLFSEEKIIKISTCAPDPNVFPAEQLEYFRKIKLQAVELYRTLAKHYQYSLVASGDAVRTISGNTEEYSNNVWGIFDDGDLSFMQLKGWRGQGTAFLIGADIKFLNDLVRRENVEGLDDVGTACGTFGALGTSYYDPLECNRRLLVNLPSCRHSIRNQHVDIAINMLRQYGVPILSSGRHDHDGSVIADFLNLRVNDVRLNEGEVPFTGTTGTDDMLDSFGTNREALSNASAYLEETDSIYLHNLAEWHVPNETPYVIGYDNTRKDVQRVVTYGRVKSSRIGLEDGLPLVIRNAEWCDGATGECGDDVIRNITYNYHRHSYYTTMSFLRTEARKAKGEYPWWEEGVVSPLLYETWWESAGWDLDQSPAVLEEINAPSTELEQIVDAEIGKKEIFYSIYLQRKVFDFNTSNYKKTYLVRINLPWQPGSFSAISGRSIGAVIGLGRARRDVFNGLRCAEFGEVGRGSCALSDYQVSSLAQVTCAAGVPIGHTCWRMTYTSEARGIITNPDPSSPLKKSWPVFFYLDGKLTDAIFFEYGDTWRDWPPLSDVLVPTYHYLRSQIDLPATDRVDGIVDRSKLQCSEPLRNSLGLRNDLVPPLENELISNSNLYEDSFQYYLEKARQAAQFAGERIAVVADTERADINYENEVAEVRAKAQTRLGEICGEGRESCSTTLNDLHIDLWWAAPTAEDLPMDFDCHYEQNYNLPNYEDMVDPPEVSSPADFVYLGRWMRCKNLKWFAAFGANYVIPDGCGSSAAT